MTIQYSVAVRNDRLDALESSVGTSPKLQLRSGSPPVNCAAADSGTLLCEIDLPSDWMAAASSGSKAKAGTWQGTAADDGTVGHFRIKDTAGTTTHMQGTVTDGAGGGDMTMDNTTVATSQVITVNTFTITAAGA
jgi:hypothetical protein